MFSPRLNTTSILCLFLNVERMLNQSPNNDLKKCFDNMYIMIYILNMRDKCEIKCSTIK